MYNQVKDARAQDSGFCLLYNPLCFIIIKENMSPPPLSRAPSGRVQN